jgi:hypothetical protein
MLWIVFLFVFPDMVSLPNIDDPPEGRDATRFISYILLMNEGCVLKLELFVSWN